MKPTDAASVLPVWVSSATWDETSEDESTDYPSIVTVLHGPQLVGVRESRIEDIEWSLYGLTSKLQ